MIPFFFKKFSIKILVEDAQLNKEILAKFNQTNILKKNALRLSQRKKEEFLSIFQRIC